MENIRITYGKTAYINTTVSIVDEVERNINITQTGDRQVLVDREELISAMSNEDGVGTCLERDSNVGKFVLAVLEKLEDGVGDVCFYC